MLFYAIVLTYSCCCILYTESRGFYSPGGSKDENADSVPMPGLACDGPRTLGYTHSQCCTRLNLVKTSQVLEIYGVQHAHNKKVQAGCMLCSWLRRDFIYNDPSFWENSSIKMPHTEGNTEWAVVSARPGLLKWPPTTASPSPVLPRFSPSRCQCLTSRPLPRDTCLGLDWYIVCYFFSFR